jgi:hypothetical protein
MLLSFQSFSNDDKCDLAPLVSRLHLFPTKKLCTIEEDIRFPNTAGGCFIKGTRVHTKNGLKRIEEINIGDEVLSSPEDGTGVPEYKKVVDTLRFAEKTLRALRYFVENDEAARVIFATGNHPFWVNGIGWTAADQLKKNDVLRMADGTRVEVASQYPVYRTKEKNIGWFQRFDDVERSHGTLIDCVNYKPIPSNGIESFVDLNIYKSSEPFLKVDVYNLEVQDFHTYYVGGGIWVHNTNCSESVVLANGKGDINDLANVARYEGSKELDLAITNAGQATSGFAVIRSANSGVREKFRELLRVLPNWLYDIALSGRPRKKRRGE